MDGRMDGWMDGMKGLDSGRVGRRLVVGERENGLIYCDVIHWQQGRF